MHGGTQPLGPASHNYKHGRYSQVLPKGLLDAYQTARTDPLLLELSDEVALLDTRLGELLGRVASGESSEAWAALGAAMTAFHRARQDKSASEMAAALQRVETIIVDAQTAQAAWEEIYSVVQHRRRLVESERKRTLELQQMLSTAQAITLIDQLMEVVARHVRDRAALAGIITDIGPLLALPGTGTPAGAPGHGGGR